MFIDPTPLTPPTALRAKINAAYRANEREILSQRIEEATLEDSLTTVIHKRALHLVEAIRKARQKAAGVDAFLTEYTLSSEEGIALMCLAEALLRIPDASTVEKLIKDKLSQGNWSERAGQSGSFFVNATTWALILTGKILNPEKAESTLSKALLTLANRSGELVIRKAVESAMQIMSKQFIMGRTMHEALKRAQKKEKQGYLYSYDMLGEAAITAHDAVRYFDAYLSAIQAIGQSIQTSQHPKNHPSISIKLSALYPKYHETQRQPVLKSLTPQLLKLAQAAKQYQIGLTIDAEESERLDLSLDIFEAVFTDPSLADWEGLGLAVQSYQKRAFPLIEWIAHLARTHKKRINVRLIKGAYWDSEIKKAQLLGLADYPVFTRKVFTDVSFQACAQKIFTCTDAIYPQFATHNAYTVAMILETAGEYQDFEFQCLHGMGQELYEEIVPKNKCAIPCRIYAPVGSYEDLLPYLVRRLLENGANSSFVNRIVDAKAPIESLIENPVTKAKALLDKMNVNIPLPSHIFGANRLNSNGMDFTDRAIQSQLQLKLNDLKDRTFEAKPKIPHFKRSAQHQKTPVFSPQQLSHCLGKVTDALPEDLEVALKTAAHAFETWHHTAVEKRAHILNNIAAWYEKHTLALIYLLTQEAGKTLSDSIGEIREAVDFCRYYAVEAFNLFKPMRLSGYTGEQNTLSFAPRGPILCISPWNFPLAIFTGQIVAALVTGNTVIAKPAEQTPLIADFAVTLMHQAGVPETVLQCLPGNGETIGAGLTADPRIKGVIFTGSTQTAKAIQRALTTHHHEITPLIAETGGLNTMIVDSSALLEQVVNDAIISAFGSAGQRCSALRVLYVQQDVYERCLTLLKGAMAELTIGNPSYLSTDIGPVIDKEALKTLQQHVEAHASSMLYQCPLPQHSDSGYFMPPTLIALKSIAELPQEVFGPVLHIIPFRIKNLKKIMQDINQTGFGLTLGIHSRISQTVNCICEHLHVGNTYVNRSMIGAVVGLQPFGGEGLSGTGPKAGGPHYLQRLCVERTLTVDTTAAGGNASLMSLPE